MTTVEIKTHERLIQSAVSRKYIALIVPIHAHDDDEESTNAVENRVQVFDREYGSHLN